MTQRLPPDDLTVVENLLADVIKHNSRNVLRRRFKHIRQQVRRRRQRAWRTGWLSSKAHCRNPLLVRLAKQLETLADEARRCAVEHAAEIIGRLAEERSIISSSSILFLVTDVRTIKAAVLYNASRSKDWEVSIEQPGIVPWVASEGKSYLAEDTGQDGRYVAKQPNTLCELAVPVKFENEVIGVLNLEAGKRGAFTHETRAYVEAKVADLVPHLLVLRAIESKAKWRCPWHPFVHGWDLRKIFQRLCDAVADDLGREATKCTIWYVDQPKQELFAYATYGYDWRFRDQSSKSLSRGHLAEIVKECPPEAVVYSPTDSEWFMDSAKARDLKIDTGLLATISSDDKNPAEAIGLVNVYLNRVVCPEMYGDREMVVRNALPEFGRILKQVIAAYNRQRVRVARSVLANETRDRNQCTGKALLERWVFKVCEIFQAPAASLFGATTDNQLVCLASTGFRRAAAGVPYGIDERDNQIDDKTISLDETPGHTVVTYRQGGRAVRRNRMGFPFEKGIPAECPKCGGRTAPEFINGERFEAGEHCKRRFLGCAVMDGETPIGALRIVRPQVSFPFTICDERLIESICQQFSGLVREHIEELNAQSPSDSDVNVAVPVVLCERGSSRRAGGRAIQAVVLRSDNSVDQIETEALQSGSIYLRAKPVGRAGLPRRVREVLNSRVCQNVVHWQSRKLKQAIRKQTADLEVSQLELIKCLARAAEFRDDNTGGHVYRVGRFARIIGEQMGLQSAFLDLLEPAAQLHDIGKIGIPHSILIKPGKLTAEEFDLIQMHCGYGKEILDRLSDTEFSFLKRHTEIAGTILGIGRSPILQVAKRVATTHHEWWDGTGYPLGLSGEDIPLEGRITAVADVFDALSSRRPCKPAFPLAKCLAMLEDGRATHFDPAVLDAFFARRNDIIQVQVSFADSQ